MLNNAALNGLEGLEKLALKPVKIDVAGLKPCDFKGNWTILNKYFRNNNRELDRFHFPVMSAEEYEALASKIGAKAHNLRFETATEYYKRKARIYAAAEDLGVSPKLLDTSSYYWDERMYLFTDFTYNLHYVEDLYRENDDRCTSAWDAYVTRDFQTQSVDLELVQKLYKFCVKAIKNRFACLIGKVDTCLGMLLSIGEYTQGGALNATKQQVSILQGYAAYFKRMCNDESVDAFLKEHNDLDVLEPGDYIATYRKLLQLLNGVGELDAKYFRAIIHNDADPMEEALLSSDEAVYDRVASLRLGL